MSEDSKAPRTVSRKSVPRNDTPSQIVNLFSDDGKGSVGSRSSIHEDSLTAFNNNITYETYTSAKKGADSDQLNLEDEFNRTLSAQGDMVKIVPPYNLDSLVNLPNLNNTLKQCIESMVTNIEGFGHRFEYVGPDGQKESEEALAEKEKLHEFFSNLNDEYSFLELRKRTRRDKETVGWAAWEVIRDATGVISMLYHIPAQTLRLTKKDKEPTTYVKTVMRNGVGVETTREKNYRRYIQEIGGKRIFFKEFGDPRLIDPDTGRENTELNFEESANEVIYMPIHTPGYIYGLPRWINQIPSILGSRESELTNLQYFRDNAIPAMAVLVSGGYLTQETLDSLIDNFNAARGRASQNRVMILEAAGDDADANEDGRVPQPKMELKPLNEQRQNEGLFQEYDMNNIKKIRSAFRLPPLLIGSSEEYSHATASTSLLVTENQVFGPERKEMDDIINQKILRDMGIRFWRFESLAPKLANSPEVVEAMRAFSNMGAITPNVAIGMANSMFDMDIKPIKEEWGDMPSFMLQVMANNRTLPDDLSVDGSEVNGPSEISDDFPDESPETDTPED